MRSTSRELIVFGASTSVLLLTYHWIFSPFYPNADGGLGNDYGLFLPRLLDGYYWYLNNGLFSNYWFSPAFCGGLPVFPNATTPFNSVPQWLTFITDPLHAVYLTHLLFAALGYLGFYLLLRRNFGISQAVALLGGTLFLFNDFYAARMLVGHLTYHAFMLTPLVAFFLLRDNNGKAVNLIFNSSVAAVLISYMLYSGMFHLIVQVILILVFIGLLHGLLHGQARRFWLTITLAGVISGLLSLPKILPTLAFLGNFQRSEYLLPGAKSLWSLLRLTFESLFLTPAETAKGVMVNMQWMLERHELEYGVTFIPLVILALGAVFAIPHIRPPSFSRRKVVIVVCMVIICVLPLALNIYTPGWNAILKETPMLRNSSTLIRWLCIYIPVVILLTTLILEHTSALRRARLWLGAAATIGVILVCVSTERGFYQHQAYQPQHILEGYKEARQSGKPPVITQIVSFTNRQGRPILPIFRNDTLVKGASQLFCYEPIFGYRLEDMPFGPLHTGRVDALQNGLFNLKNPACYVYPGENQCRPGDHFTSRQVKEAKAFVTYRPYAFAVPTSQTVADFIAGALFVGIILFWLVYPLRRLFRPRHAA